MCCKQWPYRKEKRPEHEVRAFWGALGRRQGAAGGGARAGVHGARNMAEIRSVDGGGRLGAGHVARRVVRFEHSALSCGCVRKDPEVFLASAWHFSHTGRTMKAVFHEVITMNLFV